MSLLVLVLLHVVLTITLNVSAFNLESVELDRRILNRLLIPRIPQTETHAQVRTFIREQLQRVPHMTVFEDEFSTRTPLGHKQFVNIIARWNSPHHSADDGKRIVLAAHYDSKVFDFEFIGATDSAVPCAMLIQIAQTVNDMPLALMNASAVEFIFFDGEEAFVDWSDEDSLYGSRHLAQEVYAKTPCNFDINSTTSALVRRRFCQGNLMKTIRLFILLDLIGSADPLPTFHDFYSKSSRYYSRLVNMELKLKQTRSLSSLEKSHTYFTPKSKESYFIPGSTVQIADDHVPFLKAGVPILHLISYPFPKVWHTKHDNAKIINYESVNDIMRILIAFLVELKFKK